MSIGLGRLLVIVALVLCCSGWCGDDAGRVDRRGAVLALLVGLWLIMAGRGMRRRRGPGRRQDDSLDQVTLTSRRLGLTGGRIG